MLGPYKNLQVWQKGISFVTELYHVTSHFPNFELFGLANQMRRAAVSITSNIAEGYGRSTKAELLHFLHISLGSANELDTQILISYKLGYLNSEEFNTLDKDIEEIAKMLRSLIYIKSQDNDQSDKK